MATATYSVDLPEATCDKCGTVKAQRATILQIDDAGMCIAATVALPIGWAKLVGQSYEQLLCDACVPVTGKTHGKAGL